MVEAGVVVVEEEEEGEHPVLSSNSKICPLSASSGGGVCQ